ncbi:hypothetical protein LIER_33763 [Lithospermum erythrorhizon]|uniref:Uncharacterized protein n=1 Tax=Lithospermum erythrorhizon TaxID=34254 RepID=A0AAV3S043_LITER
MKVAGAADTSCITQKFASISMHTSDQVYCTLSILEISETEGQFMKLNIDSETTTHHGLIRIQTTHSLLELQAVVEKNLPIDFICPSEPIMPNLQVLSLDESSINTYIRTSTFEIRGPPLKKSGHIAILWLEKKEKMQKKLVP